MPGIKQQPVSCDLIDRQTYLTGLAQLEADGFSHVVYHQGFRDWLKISDSFRYLVPAYRDEFVSIIPAERPARWLQRRSKRPPRLHTRIRHGFAGSFCPGRATWDGRCLSS